MRRLAEMVAFDWQLPVVIILCVLTMCVDI